MPRWLSAAAEEVGLDLQGYKRRFKNLHKKRRLSFISLHYCWLIFVTIVTSVIVYGGGKIPYIDALFFASGAATQSGLNTIDVNLLETYQQFFIYIATFFCTPIFINTVVVFVRLYWFEKRFQHVVQEARSARQSRARSFSRSIGRESVDQERANAGVNGRSITVLHDSARPVEVAEGFKEKSVMATVPESADSSASSAAGNQEHANDNDVAVEEDVVHSPRTIRFPDESFGDRTDRHIAFLQKQRNESSTKPLRIPGPREADGGALPEEVEGQADDEHNNNNSTEHEENNRHGILKIRTESQSHSIRPNVTIEEPRRPLHSITSEGRTTHRRVPSNPYALRTPTAPNEDAGGFRKRRSSMSSTNAENPDLTTGTVSYLSWQPTIGRNSLFVDLTAEQREELGGIEYRALKLLAMILVGFYLSFHLLGVIILIPWILRTDTWGQVVDAAGQNRVWWAVFSAATFFNDLGFTLTPDSFISFQQATVLLLLGSFLIVIGNTGFPCMLRFIIWIGSKIVHEESAVYQEVRFLLDHPRRCFTLLFPARANWVLFGILILLNGIDLVFFVILDLNDPVVDSLPPAFKFLDGLFQAFSTRTAGTACVNIAGLHPGILVSYLIMMYISVFPIAISVRRTNVYEERSLGIYSTAGGDDDDKEPNHVGAHVGKQLMFDLWFIALGLFIISIAEGSRISDPNEPDFTLYSIIFEIVSAYGTVGLSLGYTGINASFSAEFSVVSKLVIIVMQIRGRHRGLPYDLDRAILLPSEALNQKEQEEIEQRTLRRASTLNLNSQMTGEGLYRPPTWRTNHSLGGFSTAHEEGGQELNHVSANDEASERASIRHRLGTAMNAAARPLAAGGKFVGNMAKFSSRDSTARD